MPGATRWTKAENLAIYLFLELYPDDSPTELAERLGQSGFIKGRAVNAIRLHIDQLKKLQAELIVPDPVHKEWQ